MFYRACHGAPFFVRMLEWVARVGAAAVAAAAASGAASGCGAYHRCTFFFATMPFEQVVNVCGSKISVKIG